MWSKTPALRCVLCVCVRVFCSCFWCCFPFATNKEHKTKQTNNTIQAVYTSAVLQVCQWKLGRFPQVQVFFSLVFLLYFWKTTTKYKQQTNKQHPNNKTHRSSYLNIPTTLTCRSRYLSCVCVLVCLFCVCVLLCYCCLRVVCFMFDVFCCVVCAWIGPPIGHAWWCTRRNRQVCVCSLFVLLLCLFIIFIVSLFVSYLLFVLFVVCVVCCLFSGARKHKTHVCLCSMCLVLLVGKWRAWRSS